MATCTAPAVGIDISAETIIPFVEAHDHIPSRPHLSTLHRWRQSGRLATLMIGGRIYTSLEACERFIRSCNAAPGQPAVTTATRRRQIAAAEATLRRAGVVD